MKGLGGLKKGVGRAKRVFKKYQFVLLHKERLISFSQTYKAAKRGPSIRFKPMSSFSFKRDTYEVQISYYPNQ